jgi:hypothetical protein
MSQIYKYTLKHDSDAAQAIEMPSMAEIVEVHAQGNTVNFWAMVNSLSRVVTRNFRVYATGVNISDDVKYIGSAHLACGLVFHVTEVN